MFCAGLEEMVCDLARERHQKIETEVRYSGESIMRDLERLLCPDLPFLKLRGEGTTILLASHHREDIQELCDEVYEMEDGCLRKISAPQEFKVNDVFRLFEAR